MWELTVTIFIAAGTGNPTTLVEQYPPFATQQACVAYGATVRNALNAKGRVITARCVLKEKPPEPEAQAAQ